jgi:predicted MFS family arabinose efflux permease
VTATPVAGVERVGLTPAERAALTAVAAQFFVNGCTFASFVPRLPEVRDATGITLDRLGLLQSIAAVAGFAGNLSVSAVLERLGSRRTVRVCGTILCCALPLIGFAETQWVLLLGLLVMMSVDVMVDVAMNLQGSWLSARRTTPVMNRLHGLWSLGSLSGAAAGVFLTEVGVGLDAHLVVAAVVLLAAQWVGSRWLLGDDDAYRHRPPGVAATNGAPRRRRAGLLGLIGLGVLGFGGVAMEVTPGDWAAFRFTDDLGTSEGFAALGFAAVAGGMTIGRFGGDWIAHRTSPQRLSRVAMSTAVVGVAVATLVPNRFVDLGGFFVAGLGAATLLPTLYDRAARRPGRAGAGLGALTAGLRIGFLTLPLATGALAGTSLGVGVSVAIVVAMAAVLFVAADAASTRYRPAPAPSTPPT